MRIGVGAHGRVPSIIVFAAVLAIAAGGASDVWAQRACSSTQPFCPSADVTVSKVQIGGVGSLSSNGSAFSNPGRLDDGTIAEADLIFTYTRSTGVLSLQVINQTATTASLTGFSFNTPPAVTGLSLISHTGSLPWELGYDSNRTDNVVDTHPTLKILKMDGMGAFNVVIANKGIDTGASGGDPLEILAGQSVTYTIQVSGSTGSLTACDFTSSGSLIPPGDKITIAVGRFQAGAQGGSGFISPCGPGDLLVTLSSFSVSPDDGAVKVRWSTAAEIDNAGFAVLRKAERSGVFERVTPALIPGNGSTVSGATYSFDDRTAVNGVKYLYVLEDFDLNGINTLHPPRRTVANPAAPPITLEEPAYEAAVGNSIVLRWSGDRRLPVSIQISADPGFPSGETLVLGSGAGSVRRLSPRERSQVREMAASGAEGGVYWKVTGRSPRGSLQESQTWFMFVER